MNATVVNVYCVRLCLFIADCKWKHRVRLTPLSIIQLLYIYSNLLLFDSVRNSRQRSSWLHYAASTEFNSVNLPFLSFFSYNCQRFNAQNQCLLLLLVWFSVWLEVPVQTRSSMTNNSFVVRLLKVLRTEKMSGSTLISWHKQCTLTLNAIKKMVQTLLLFGVHTVVTRQWSLGTHLHTQSWLPFFITTKNDIKTKPLR